MSALVTCVACFKNVQESNALTSLDVPGEWWICKPCAKRGMKELYDPLVKYLHPGNAVLDAIKKTRGE